MMFDIWYLLRNKTSVEVVGDQSKQTCASQLVMEHAVHGVALLHYLSSTETVNDSQDN